MGKEREKKGRRRRIKEGSRSGERGEKEERRKG